MLYFLLTVLLETNYLGMYFTKFSEYVHMGGRNQSDLLFEIAQGTLLWYDNPIKI